MRIPLILLAGLAITACATTPTTSGIDAAADAEAAAVKAEKDRLACRKMCEMAGATEDNADAVADCQAKCDAGATAP